MKKATVNIPFEGEKLKALRMYMKQKNLSVETVLGQELEGLYQKHVPSNVRFFLENREGEHA